MESRYQCASLPPKCSNMYLLEPVYTNIVVSIYSRISSICISDFLYLT